MPSPDHSMYCRTCRRALNTRSLPGDMIEYIHAAEVRGEPTDHRPDPVPLTELPDAIQICDFCSRTAQWVYACADRLTDIHRVTKRYVGLADYRERHGAARSIRNETTVASTQSWGERWAACDGCMALIQDENLEGLITRAVESLPSKLTRGKRLARVRATLRATYEHIFATRLPGRGRVTSDNPLGVWENPGGRDNEPSSGADREC